MLPLHFVLLAFVLERAAVFAGRQNFPTARLAAFVEEQLIARVSAAHFSSPAILNMNIGSASAP